MNKCDEDNCRMTPERRSRYTGDMQTMNFVINVAAKIVDEEQ